MTRDKDDQVERQRAARQMEERQARLAKALRENLRKRKGQARARSDQAEIPAPPDKGASEA